MRKPFAINNANSQYQRWLKALDADYALVDGRSLSELLNFSTRFARLINYYNLQDRVDGDWVEFFLQDSSIVIASINACNVQYYEDLYCRLEKTTLDKHCFDEKFESLRAMCSVITDIAHEINGWLIGLRQNLENECANQLYYEIEQDIKQTLSAQLRQLKSYDKGAGLKNVLCERLNLNYRDLAAIWELKKVRAVGDIYYGRRGTGKINHSVPYFRPIFDNFLYVLKRLEYSAKSLLPFTLVESNHKPQSAMYIAFAKIFQYAQNNANTFSQRFISFYYHDMLREYKQMSVPDQTYLSLTLVEDDSIPFSMVPAGTTFDAGQDTNEQDIIFSSIKDLIVTQASLQQIYTLGISRGSLVIGNTSDEQLSNPANSQNTNIIQQVIVSDIKQLIDNNENQVENAEDDETSRYDRTAEPTGTIDWPTFGSTNANSKESTHATLGFAVSSNDFLLGGGNRNITTSFYLEDNPTLIELLEEIDGYVRIGIDEMFCQIIQQSLSVYMSTYNGWLAIDDFGVQSLVFKEAPDEKNRFISLQEFAIAFQLDEDAPGFNPYNLENEDAEEDVQSYPVSDDPSVISTNPNPDRPTLKFYLQQDPIKIKSTTQEVSIYPLSVLNQLNIEFFSITCQVNNLTGLTLENIDGEIDPSSPYMAFGALPVFESTLSIKNDEIFSKTIDSLTVDLKWFNLPQNNDGFYGYYKDYVIDIDGNTHPPGTLFNNRTFQNTIQIKSPGRWTNTNPDQQRYLFRTEKPGQDKINPSKDGKLLAPTLFDQIIIESCEPSTYYRPSDSSIEITLSNPTYAFGNDLYTKNVLKSVIDDLPDPDKCTEECKKNLEPVTSANTYIIKTIEYCQQEETLPACVIKCIETGYQLFTLYYRCKKSCSSNSATTIRFSNEQNKSLQNIQEQLKTLHSLSETDLKASCTIILSEIEKLEEKQKTKEFSRCDSCPPVLNAFHDLVYALIYCLFSQDNKNTEQSCILESLAAIQEKLETENTALTQTCMENCMQIKDELNYPNTPYLPQLENLKLSYSSYRLHNFNNLDSNGDGFYHLLPFDSYNTVNAPEDQFVPLLPQFAYHGNLYLGFSTHLAQQVLNLLFQMSSQYNCNALAQCSPLPDIQYEYLSNNGWQCISYKSVSDESSHYLQKSGIIEINLPNFSVNQNTTMPNNAYWLRLGVENFPDCFPNAINIFNNALLTTRLLDDEQLLANFPLPAHTIQGALDDVLDIDNIDQPIESFGGQNKEDGKQFEIRVGERLRHKDRGILDWDYERLVLEQFPEIWKIKTLPVYDNQQSDQPGHVLLVVIPGPDSADIMDPTTPAVSSERLQRIYDFLIKRTNPFIILKVLNPVYVHIEVVTEVAFTSQQKSGELIKQLNTEIIKYLSPWFYNEAREKTDGFYVSEAYIKDFISNKTYIKDIHSLSLNYSIDLEKSSLQWYFLTSASHHQIREFEAVACKKHKSTTY